MKKKYKIILITVLSFIILISFIGLGSIIYKYYYKDNNAEVINDNGLSINYLNGKKYEFKNKEKHIKFSLINKGEEDVLFHIALMNYKCDGKTSYSLIENGKEIVSNKELKSNSDISITDFSQISIGNTNSYELIIYNNSYSIVNFELVVEKVSENDPNFVQTILNDNYINNDPKTKVGSEIANTDEGIIMDIDDYGNTYYFRGNSEKNYVKFADKNWRIVRINGDGTIRLILDETISNSAMYTMMSDEGLNDFKNFERTIIYKVLDNWYEENLKEYDSYISSSKFCSDVNTTGNNLNNYVRNNISNLSTFNCLGMKNVLKIGLLTIDEIIYAGSSVNEGNQNYYLYNEKIDAWWTMSAAKTDENGAYFYSVNKDGSVNSDTIGNVSKSIRPVINLKKEISMTGEGTKDKPYTIE